MTPKPDTWMPLYVGDYRRDTNHLSTMEHGAYCLLLMHGWMYEGKIPAGDSELMAITGMKKPAWRKSKRKILAFFSRQGRCFVQKRQLAELAKARELQAALHARALAGGRATKQAWGRLKAGVTPAPSPSPSPSHNNTKGGANAPAGAPGPVPFGQVAAQALEEGKP